MQLRSIASCCLLVVKSIFGNAQGTFTEYIPLHCNDSVIRKNLGYPSWNPAILIKKPQFGIAEIREDSFLRQSLYYKPPIYFHGYDTLMVLCAKATQITCDTGIYILEVSCNAQIDSFIVINTKCEKIDTLRIDDAYNAEISESHIHGQVSMLLGLPEDRLLYQSESKYEGQDYVLLYLNQLRQYWLVIYNVACNISSTQNTANKAQWAETIFVTNDFLHYNINNTESSNQELLLFDLHGKQFKLETEMLTNGLQLKLNELPSGYYFLTSKSNKQAIHQRFILLH